MSQGDERRPVVDGSTTGHPVLIGGEALAQDERLHRGFGDDKFHPYSFEQRAAELAPQIRAVASRAAAIPANLRGERVIVELTLLPNYLASSYQPSELLEECDLRTIGSRLATAPYHTKTGGLQAESQATKAIQVAATDKGLERLKGLTEGTLTIGPTGETLRQQIQSLWRVELPGASRLVVPETEDPDEPAHWEAVLHPGTEPSSPTDGRLVGSFAQLVAELGGSVDLEWRREVGGLTYVPLTLSSRAATKLDDFNPLKHLHPQPDLPKLRGIDPAGDVAEATAASPFSSDPVAIFDLGVDHQQPLFRSAVTSTDLTDQPQPTEHEARHGALVTSSLLYGPMAPGTVVDAPKAPVHHYRISPPPAAAGDRGVYWVLDQIVTILESDRYRIAVITTGPERQVGAYGDAVSSWTARLDAVAQTHDVLIVTAAGNTGGHDPRPADGSDRVAIPSDCVNGMSVGAAVGTNGSWRRCAYSSRGPGRAGARVQPSVMAFGGDQHGPFFGVGHGGDIVGDWGTSFAAPYVAGELARLGHVLGDRAFPETLRAFAVHGSEPHPDAVAEDHGWGLFPSDVLAGLDGGPDAVTVLYQDALERGRPVSLPVPVPAAATGLVGITWTVSFMSPVDPTNAPEYTQSGLEVHWRPNANRFSMRPPRGQQGARQKIDLGNPSGKALYESLLAKGWRRTNPPTATRSRMATEQELRDEGKWETVFRETVRHRATKLESPALWLNYLHRKDGVLQSPDASPELPVSVLITVRGKAGSDLHSAVRAVAPFNTLRPLVVKLPVRT